MKSQDEKAGEIFHPKTPGPRRPLHATMSNSMRRGNRQTNSRNQRQIDESDYDSVDDPYTDDLESDEESYSDESHFDEVVDELVERHLSRNVRSSSLRPSPVSQTVRKSPVPPRSLNSSQTINRSVGKDKVPSRTSERYEPEKIVYDRDGESAGSKFFPYLIVFIIVGGLIISYITRGMLVQSTNNGTLSDAELMKNFGANIEDISYTFTKQHSDIWDEIYAGVMDIVEHPSKRSIIFLFSNQDDPMLCLAKMLGNATKSVLHSDDSLWLTPLDFVNDYGEVIEKFRESIEKKKVVIIENILGINPEAMRAFHNFCDSENPLVRQTVYIITMVVRGFKGNEKPHVFVEEQLRRKLDGKIKPDKLQPLITRLTDAAIIHVQPEPDITSCPLRY